MWNKKVINEWSEKTNIKKHFKVFISFFIEWENQQIIGKKMKKEIKQQKKKKKKKKASSPDQDLHPDWDRFRGTMLYPLSCGELAMKGEQMLRWYVTSGVRNARNKWTKILRKKGFDSKKTLL